MSHPASQPELRQTRRQSFRLRGDSVHGSRSIPVRCRWLTRAASRWSKSAAKFMSG